MIVAPLSDRLLRVAIRRAAHPEEDVFCGSQTVQDALEFGFPRLLVRDGGEGMASSLFDGGAPSASLPTLVLTRAILEAWEAERRRAWVPAPRVDHVAKQMRFLIGRSGARPTWVDRILADLTRASGRTLPPPFRGFARRILEFPSRYQDLHAVAGVATLTRGALKARFRRRGLPSPSSHLRWLRVMAAAHVLSNDSVTTIEAAHRLGFTTGGNFCRMMKSTTGLTPTEVRSHHGRSRLIAGFAEQFLDQGSIVAWADLEDLFVRAA